MRIPYGWRMKLEKLAIPDLLYVIFWGQAAAFVGVLYQPQSINLFVLDPNAIRAGQWWRLLTFNFFPISTNLIFFIFVMMFYLWIAKGLELAWGSFKVNLFYFLGMASHILVAMLFNVPLTAQYLSLTLFLAFAMYYPDETILLFFILPVKVKWMAWVDAAFIILGLLHSNLSQQIVIVLLLLNFVLFFWREFWNGFLLWKQSSGKKVVFAEAVKLKEKIPSKQCVQCGLTAESGADIRLCTCSLCGPDGKSWCYDHVQEHLNKSIKPK